MYGTEAGAAVVQPVRPRPKPEPSVDHWSLLLSRHLLGEDTRRRASAG